MGTYYGTQGVVKHGMPVIAVQETREEIRHTGDKLVAILGANGSVIARDMTADAEYERTMREFSEGNWSSFDVYRVPRGEIADCRDLGALDITEYYGLVKKASKRLQSLEHRSSRE